MAKSKKQVEFAKIPRVLAPKTEETLPDLLTAFQRWQEMGEYPASAVLCEFVGTGGEIGNAAYKDVATGKRISKTQEEDWKFLTEIQFKPGKIARGMFVIFEKTN